MTRAAGYRACVDKSAVGQGGKRTRKTGIEAAIDDYNPFRAGEEKNKQIINKLYDNDNNAPINSKVHLNFQNRIVQIPSPRGKKAVQMPHQLVLNFLSSKTNFLFNQTL